ncbi:hypothetical protein [Geobacillus zalihae]|uniref:hypothetical protein n=1 Tax=Geobacillus zalihae TaxID=213419 RepID=UPI00168111E6|nr:hypothetical protein [Geobacillus zalihae]QNU24802.1 hypothetical protein IC806_00030 [Geobacillus zalihae]
MEEKLCSKSRNKRRKEAFKEIWRKIAAEKKFTFEEEEETEKFLFWEGDTPIGTMEFVPYNPTVFTTVENEFPFSSLPEIRNNKGKVWEVDKVGFLPEYRKKAISNGLLIV